jgi:hypothetical protein
MYKMPCYEAKYFPKNDWEEISDIELMDGLYKIYHKVTPVITEMIQGKEIQIADAVYRLKWKGGDSTSTDGMNICQ